MASVSNKDIPIEFGFMADYWNFRKKFYIPEDNDAFWAELRNAGLELGYKYDPELKDNPGKASFYGAMIEICVTDIERRGKSK